MKQNKDKLAFLAKVDEDYFQGGGALMLNIEFSRVYNLITLACPGCYLHEVVDIVSPLKPKKIFL